MNFKTVAMLTSDALLCQFWKGMHHGGNRWLRTLFFYVLLTSYIQVTCSTLAQSCIENRFEMSATIQCGQWINNDISNVDVTLPETTLTCKSRRRQAVSICTPYKIDVISQHNHNGHWNKLNYQVTIPNVLNTSAHMCWLPTTTVALALNTLYHIEHAGGVHSDATEGAYLVLQCHHFGSAIIWPWFGYTPYTHNTTCDTKCSVTIQNGTCYTAWIVWHIRAYVQIPCATQSVQTGSENSYLRLNVVWYKLIYSACNEIKCPKVCWSTCVWLKQLTKALILTSGGMWSVKDSSCYLGE